MYSGAFEELIRRVLPPGVNDPHFYVTLNNHHRIKELELEMGEAYFQAITAFGPWRGGEGGRQERRYMEKINKRVIKILGTGFQARVQTVARAVHREWTIEENKKLKR